MITTLISSKSVINIEEFTNSQACVDLLWSIIVKFSLSGILNLYLLSIQDIRYLQFQYLMKTKKGVEQWLNGMIISILKIISPVSGLRDNLVI